MNWRRDMVRQVRKESPAKGALERQWWEPTIFSLMAHPLPTRWVLFFCDGVVVGTVLDVLYLSLFVIVGSLFIKTPCDDDFNE